ncbi:MAG: hypothetical protein ACI8YP_003266 [Algoriphagus sp.]|jgi:hypothetical protein
MKCNSILYSDHSVSQMFKRDISIDEVEYILASGEIIKAYKDDKPFPSYVMLGILNDKSIHLVVAMDPLTQRCVIITTYIPDLSIWQKDFKTKK